MRIFIGIEFSNALKGEIAALQSLLRPQTIRGRWKHTDNFHLTLKFLDEVEASLLPAINKELAGVCARHAKFTLTISKLDCFQGRDSVGVLWLGMEGARVQLERLQKDIEQRMSGLGFARERRTFTPHITIGQDLVFACDVEKWKETRNAVEFSTLAVDSVHLFKSEQIGKKRVYTSLSSHSLLEEHHKP